MINNTLKSQLITLRRDLHRFPELGFLEICTASKLYEALNALGWSVKTGRAVMDPQYMLGAPTNKEITNYLDTLEDSQAINERFQEGLTGIVATIDLPEPGPTTAFRFDIDALPIMETTKQQHLPVAQQFRSMHDNVMHACGHDVHMTMGIGLANLITTEGLNKGRIKLIFQPAEEGVRGALSMVKQGVVDDVDYFFASHIGLTGHSDEIITSLEGFMASTKFNIRIKGESSHAGASPQEGKNAVLAGATLVQQLYAIERHEAGDARINVGRITGGSGRNVIADYCNLEMEVRGVNNEVNDFMVRRVTEIVRGVEKMFGVTIEIDKVGEAPSILPSPRLKEAVYKMLSDKFTTLNIIKEDNTPSGSEDATYFINRVKELGKEGLYLNIGSTHEQPHHHPEFDVQESDMFNGIEALYAIAEHFHK